MLDGSDVLETDADRVCQLLQVLDVKPEEFDVVDLDALLTIGSDYLAAYSLSSSPPSSFPWSSFSISSVSSWNPRLSGAFSAVSSSSASSQSPR